MKRTLRRIASWLCVLSLCLSLLPGTAWAADPSLIEETPPVTEQSGCICNATDGVHNEDCPLYKGSESVDEPECTCETVDGVHAEDCPLYEVPESEEPACTCKVVDGIHAKDCPLYVAPDPIEEESETVLTELQDRIDTLPEVAELEDMDEDELNAVYLEACAIWDEIDLLSKEATADLDTTILEALSKYFAALVPQPEEDYTITPSMTQEEVDAVINDATGTITIQAGDYGIEDEKNHIKINLKNGNQTVQLEESGEYNRLMFVVLSDGNTLEANGATIYGDVFTVYNQSPAIYIPYGSLELEGNLTIDDHDYGVILGFTNGTAEHESVLTLAESAELNIVNCKKISDVGGDSSYDGGIVCRDTDYFSYVDTQGDGTCGSGITTKGQGNTRAKVVVSPNAELSVTNNSGAGIFSVNADNFTLDIQPGAEVDLSGNGQGICMNTDYTGSVDVNVDNAALTITDNSSNGITGQSLPYLLDIKNDSTVTVDNNGGIGINNFFIQVSDSELSVSENGSHGATNVALDAVDSTVETSGNTYRGLNITKGNVKEDLDPDLNPAVTLISHSTIIAEENKQSGIYFINSAGTLIENSSTIETSGNGITSPGSTFSGAGIVGSYDVTVVDSMINSADPHSFSISHTSTSPAVWYVKENVVAVAQGTVEQDGRDIVDDYNNSHGPGTADPYLGKVVITGGSLDASVDITYEDYQTYLDDSEGWTYEDVTNTVSLVNDRDEDLFRFHLNSELNTVVGGSGERSFSYPYQEGAGELTYQFVYDESGDAYVWTPVTVVQYDATEGEIDTLGTAVSVEDAVVDAGDITIYGNSLALAERQLPTASKEGAVFSGWYYAVGKADIAQAAKYAEAGEYADLYELLLTRGRVLDANTLTSDDSYAKKGFATKRAAKQHEAVMRQKLMNPSYVPPTAPQRKITVQEYLDEWLERHGSTNLRPSTKASYGSHIRNHINPYIGDLPLSQVTPAILDDLFQKLYEKGLSGSSVKYAHRILGVAFEHARKYHYIETNPVRDTITKFGKQGKTPDPYTIEQMRALLANVNGTQWELAIILAGLYGLRLSECIGLRWSNVDFSKKTFAVVEQLPYGLPAGTKIVSEMAPVKSSERVLPITQATMTYFERQFAQRAEQKKLFAASEEPYFDNELVISKANGIPARRERISANFGQLLRQLGMPHMRFHDLRHTAATNMHQLTGDFYTVGQILGHSLKGVGIQLGMGSNLESVTAQYVDVRLDRKRIVLEAYHNEVLKGK